MLPKRDKASVTAVLAGVVTSANQLCCDGGKAIAAFARIGGIRIMSYPNRAVPNQRRPICLSTNNAIRASWEDRLRCAGSGGAVSHFVGRSLALRWQRRCGFSLGFQHRDRRGAQSPQRRIFGPTAGVGLNRGICCLGASDLSGIPCGGIRVALWNSSRRSLRSLRLCVEEGWCRRARGLGRSLL
jgi:hypothetical protein